MLDYLFFVFIYPIEWLLRTVLEWGISQTHSYGLGIIVLSLVINFLLIPVYHIAETWQEAERSVQKRMADKLAHIKKTFFGNERYMVTRTLYRQYGYHPIFAMRASVGLLIQVPFFFAAYQVLSTYAPLQGASFAGLADLAKPDALLHIKGLAINVLPIIMTLISLASAQVYTTRLAKRDRIQLYSMAALLGCVFGILRGALRALFVLCSTYYAISSTLYLFVLTKDYGVLDAFIFQFQNKIYAPYENISYLLIDIGIAASLISLFILCIRAKKLPIIKYSLFICLLITIGTGVVPYMSLSTPRIEPVEIIQNEDAGLPCVC